MNILEIIEKKKLNKKLSSTEINYFVNEYIKGEKVQDYQASSLLMAMRLNGLSVDETYYLTKAFVETSELYTFKKNKPTDILIDKHSSGGVGDKVSIILLPMLIALGLCVPKISGKGLGHTGGTIDKIAAVGMKSDYSLKQANQIFAKVGGVIMQQTKDLVPADNKLYALRDVSGTVDAPGLMTSSILSKKFVVNSDYIFIDLKMGEGALLTDLKQTEALAQLMLAVAKKMKRKISISITNMNQPLGQAIGNFLEIQEAVDFLNQTSIAADLKTLIYSFVTEILIATKKVKTDQQALKLIEGVLASKKALAVFNKWVLAQGGKYDPQSFKPKYQYQCLAKKSGYINYVSTHEMGIIALLLGAGRKTKTDVIDMVAGIYLNKQHNASVKKNEVIATLYSSNKIQPDVIKRLEKNVCYVARPTKVQPLILKVLNS